MVEVAKLYCDYKCLIPSWDWLWGLCPQKGCFHTGKCVKHEILHKHREMFLPLKSLQCHKPKYGKSCREKKKIKKSFLLLNIDQFYSQVCFQARKDKSPFHETLKYWERNTKFTNSFQCSSLFYHHYWKLTGPETFLA